MSGSRLPVDDGVPVCWALEVKLVAELNHLEVFWDVLILGEVSIFSLVMSV